MTVRRTVHALIAALLTTFALVAVAQPSTAASSTFNITGVASLDGHALPGVTAHLMQAGDDGYGHLHNATTNSKGSYSFSKLPVGTVSDPLFYAVIFTNSNPRVVVAVRYLKVKPGATVTRNVTLKRAATLTGTLSRADNTTPHNISALLDDPDISPVEEGLDRYDPARRIHVHTNGAYEFDGVAPGTHYVQFSDDSGKYLDQCYDNVLTGYYTGNTYCGSDKTDVTLAGGETVALHPQLMSHVAHSISGTVKDSAGNPLESIEVTPYVSTEDSIHGEAHLAGTGTTGNFTAEKLYPATYQLYVQDQNNIWAPQWYDRKTTQSDATILNVGANDVTGVNITMLSRSIIRVLATAGSKSATFDVVTTRKAGGPRPGGSVTVNQGYKTITGDLVDGHAIIKLSGLTPGKRTITVTYNGNSTTAGTSKQVVVMVKE